MGEGVSSVPDRIWIVWGPHCQVAQRSWCSRMIRVMMGLEEFLVEAGESALLLLFYTEFFFTEFAILTNNIYFYILFLINFYLYF
jgi:hypothetical protein